MPRISEGRPPAEPSSAGQKDRYQRMLRAAVRQGNELGFEHVQMQDIATEAEVAIATLYRYFPSKVHLFVGVMKWRVDRLDQARIIAEPGQDAIGAVSELLNRMTLAMYAERRLSLAMIQSMIFAESLTSPDHEHIKFVFQEIILRLAQWHEDPSDDQRRRAWLLTQCWFGVLMMVLNGSRPRALAEADIRRACELLLG
ncbi:MAG TPA: TetR family transcriptional regulator [Marmoricola sp.]|nr:TetR family transcriptional regulator [Marmoricola sp.]